MYNFVKISAVKKIFLRNLKKRLKFLKFLPIKIIEGFITCYNYVRAPSGR